MAKTGRLMPLVSLLVLLATTLTACGSSTSSNGPISVTSMVGGCNTMMSATNPLYYIETTLSSTSHTEPGRDYAVSLVENPVVGNSLNLSPQTVSWSQREMDLKETKKVRWIMPADKAALYNLDFYKDYMFGSSFLEGEERAYSDKVQKTIREHFTVSWR